MLQGFQTLEIAASNFERSCKFYRDLLGGQPGAHNAHRAEFRFGALRVLVVPLRAGWAPVKNCVMPVLHSNQLEHDLAALHSQGAAILEPVHAHGPGQMAEIGDPDGYRVGIYQPGPHEAVPKVYSEAEFAKKASAIQRDLREAMTATRKVPSVAALRKSVKAKAMKPAKAAKAKPAKDKKKKKKKR